MFLFATYVSVTGGPNLQSDRNKPDSERMLRIAAQAQQVTPQTAPATKAHPDGCCTKKESTASPAAPENKKSSCTDPETGKCEHH